MTARETGFTLVEVMTASVILGLAVSAVCFMVINSDVLRLRNDHYRQARAIAQEELEDPNDHFFKYSGLRAFANEPINLDHGHPSQAATTAYRDLDITLLNEPMVGGVNAPYRLLSSKVTWPENGQTKSVTLFKRVAQVK